MVKVISVSMSEWVFNTYLSNFHGNRSKHIEGNFVKGLEVDLGDFESTKQRLISLMTEFKNKEVENFRLKQELERTKKKTKKEMSDNIKYDKSLLQAGVLK